MVGIGIAGLVERAGFRFGSGLAPRSFVQLVQLRRSAPHYRRSGPFRRSMYLFQMPRFLCVSLFLPALLVLLRLRRNPRIHWAIALHVPAGVLGVIALQ